MITTHSANALARFFSFSLRTEGKKGEILLLGCHRHGRDFTWGFKTGVVMIHIDTWAQTVLFI